MHASHLTHYNYCHTSLTPLTLYNSGHDAHGGQERALQWWRKASLLVQPESMPPTPHWRLWFLPKTYTRGMVWFVFWSYPWMVYSQFNFFQVSEKRPCWLILFITDLFARTFHSLNYFPHLSPTGQKRTVSSVHVHHKQAFSQAVSEPHTGTRQA